MSSLYYMVSIKGLIVEKAAAQAYSGCLKYLDQINKKNNILIENSDKSQLNQIMGINSLVLLGGKNISM